MICRPCRLGADLIAHDSDSPTAVAIGEKLHEKCDHCDCQHKVEAQLNGKVVRR